MSKPRVTYLLGAGASYNALPIVSEVSEQLQYLHGLLGSNSLDGYASGNTPNDVLKKKLMKILEDLISGIARSTTIDNYATALSSNGSRRKLHELKAGLSFYFTVKQLAPVGLFTRSMDEPLSDIDNRYLPLLLKYLPFSGEDISLPSNINFISWNYDFQLELALKQIREYDSLEKVFANYPIYPDPTHQNPNGKQIVHLNGIAGSYKVLDSGKYNHIFDRHHGERDIKTILSNAMFIFNSIDREQISFDELFSFAWESDVKESADAVIRAKQIVRDTKILVVIGYSFPDYNRDVDREIFRNGMGIEKIYYQDPNSHLFDIKSTFDLFDTEVVEWDRKFPFLVPPEY